MSLLRIIGWITLLGSPLLAAGAQNRRALVRTESGVIQGSADDAVSVYRGIPFAAPPIGELRWKAPQPVARWAGVRYATRFGPDCMQKADPPLAVAGPGGFSEDCLYLNVWTPARGPGAKLPVMVWIYGGGFVNGGSSSRIYDGEHFARNGIVFVSLNYRLGRFGFFAFPALSREGAGEPLNNYGYMDQIAALRWVRRNIGRFGGDAENVTLFGQSAGGASVLTLLTSPLAQGLFSKAIVESGGGRQALLGIRYLDRRATPDSLSAEETGEAFAKEAGIEGTGAAALAALRALPAERLVDGLNMNSLRRAANTWSGPIVDGALVTQPAEAAVIDGSRGKVRVMIGANSADVVFPRWHSMADALTAFGPDLRRAAALYDPAHSGNWMVVGWRVCADLMMIEPARHVARALAAAGSPTWEYRFSYVAESKRSFLPGALHATEVPFVFDTLGATGVSGLTAEDQAMADEVSRYWMQFAKTGDPNGPGLPQWPQYDATGNVLMNFTNDGPVSEADPWKERLDLMEKVAERSGSGLRNTATRPATHAGSGIAPGG